MGVRTLNIILACGILGVSLAPNAALSAPPSSKKPITKKNWKQHPRIVEVRKVYDEIQSLLKQKKLKIRERNFRTAIEACNQVTYPMEFVRIGTDDAGRVRLFVSGQRISDNALLTQWEYYDKSGHLRFVDRTEQLEGFVPIEDRIYLTDQGRVFWDLRTEGKKTTFGEEAHEPYGKDPFELTSSRAMNLFKVAGVECDK